MNKIDVNRKLCNSETNLHLDVVVTHEILLSKCENGFLGVLKENTRGNQHNVCVRAILRLLFEHRGIN